MIFDLQDKIIEGSLVEKLPIYERPRRAKNSRATERASPGRDCSIAFCNTQE